MEKIIKYKTIDGEEFENKEDGENHESLIDRVGNLMSLLPKTPNTDFFNGEGFIQHDRKNLIRVRRNLLEICKEYIDHNWIHQTIDNETVDPSWVARLLGDYNIRPLCKAWNRFYCIDNKYREWGQPYFALNPEEGINKCLNK